MTISQNYLRKHNYNVICKSRNILALKKLSTTYFLRKFKINVYISCSICR